MEAVESDVGGGEAAILGQEWSTSSIKRLDFLPAVKSVRIVASERKKLGLPA